MEDSEQNTKKEEVKNKIKNVGATIKHHGERISHGAKRYSYLINCIVMAILLFVFNNLSNWHISWLAPNFDASLLFFNVLFVLIIVANILYLFFDRLWFRALCQMIINIIALIAFYTFYLVFPLSLSEKAEHRVNVLLIVVILFSAVGVVIELIRLITRLNQKIAEK